MTKEKKSVEKRRKKIYLDGLVRFLGFCLFVCLFVFGLVWFGFFLALIFVFCSFLDFVWCGC